MGHIIQEAHQKMR